MQRNVLALNAKGCIISKDSCSVLSNLHGRCLGSEEVGQVDLQQL
jgi:hypothetical protein